MLTFIDKIIRNEPGRPTRFHDLKGHLNVAALFCELPLAILDRGKSPAFENARPWIPPSATRRLGEIGRSRPRVIEFGAGYSTAWWSKRAQSVKSFEADPSWKTNLQAYLEAASIKNVEVLKFDDLWNMPASFFADADLFVIDGPSRDRCAEMVIKYARPGACVYLDNSDRTPIDPEYARSEAYLKSRAASVEYFTGYPPGILFLCEGMFVTLH